MHNNCEALYSLQMFTHCIVSYHGGYGGVFALEERDEALHYVFVEEVGGEHKR